MGIKEAIEGLRKQYGAGSVLMGQTIIEGVKGISTGALSLDIALGCGGFPRGRISEVFGAESTGKTTLCLEAIAKVQKAGGKAVFIDTEHALDRYYAKNGIGVDIDNLIFSQPDCGEEALDIAKAFLETKEVDIIVIDSVANLIPKAELEGEVGDIVMAGIARLMSSSLRKIVGAVRESNAALVFINQTREKVGMVFGNPNTQPGGKALKFYSSCRIELTKTGNIKVKEETTGANISAKVIKNKVAPPFRVAKYDIFFGKGISDESIILDMSIKIGVVEQSGSSYFTVNGQKINGRGNALEYLEKNPEYCAKLRQQALAAIQPDSAAAVVESTNGSEEAE
jgi:recombination protein RecA